MKSARYSNDYGMQAAAKGEPWNCLAGRAGVPRVEALVIAQFKKTTRTHSVEFRRNYNNETFEKDQYLNGYGFKIKYCIIFLNDIYL